MKANIGIFCIITILGNIRLNLKVIPAAPRWLGQVACAYLTWIFLNLRPASLLDRGLVKWRGRRVKNYPFKSFLLSGFPDFLIFSPCFSLIYYSLAGPRQKQCVLFRLKQIGSKSGLLNQGAKEGAF